jgi:hypothetical protein
MNAPGTMVACNVGLSGSGLGAHGSRVCFMAFFFILAVRLLGHVHLHHKLYFFFFEFSYIGYMNCVCTQMWAQMLGAGAAGVTSIMAALSWWYNGILRIVFVLAVIVGVWGVYWLMLPSSSDEPLATPLEDEQEKGTQDQTSRDKTLKERVRR